MIEVTIKTLDSENYKFSVENDATVKKLKELISTKVNIPPDTQRLIFCGRVLQDDKLLSEYDVHEKTIHLVQKPPPAPSSPSSNQSQASGAQNQGQPSSQQQRFIPGRTVHIPTGPPGANSLLVGAFTFDANRLRGIVESVVSQVGNVVGAQNAQVTYVTSRSSQDGSSLDVHINIDQVPGGEQRNDATGEANPSTNSAQQDATTQERMNHDDSSNSMNPEPMMPQPNVGLIGSGRPSSTSGNVPNPQGQAQSNWQGAQGDAGGPTGELNQLGQQLSQLVGGLLNSLLQHPVVNPPVAIPIPAPYQNLAQVFHELTQREVRIFVSTVASNPPTVYQYIIRDRNMIPMVDRDIQTPHDWNAVEAEVAASNAVPVPPRRAFRMHSNEDNQSASMSVGSDETDDADGESMEVVDVAEIESLPEMDHTPVEARPARPSAPPLVNQGSDDQTPSVFKRPLTVPTHRELGAHISIGSKPWHSNVPHDWIPIMEEDTEKQRREKPQRPFSDAYLHGVPKKRRRGNATAASIQPMPTLLSSMLEQAIDSVGARPISESSPQQISQGASQDERLLNTFEQNMQRTLANRVSTDPDYDPTRFQKTKDYLSL